MTACFPSYLCIQHQDDVCGASPDGCDSIVRFYKTYIKICEDLGIDLADPIDPGKTFAPCTNGQVLGINYDTEEGTIGI